MSYRVVELVLPEDKLDKAKEVLARFESGVVLQHCFLQGISELLLRVVVATPHSENVIDELRAELLALEDTRLMVFSAEAAIPTRSNSSIADQNSSWFSAAGVDRVSREELRSDVEEMSRISSTFCAWVVLSTVVAAVGLYRNSIPVLIGAMVIAPLLGPNIALAFGTALGELSFIHRALKINIVGSGLAFILSLVIGYFVAGTPEVDALAMRVTVGVDDIVLALAAGVAGVLSLTAGASTSLVGVMVAVALLPPLVAVGLLLSAGYPGAALTSLLLLVINVVSINLAAVATFAVQQVRPSNWWAGQRATAYTRWAFLFWSILILLFAALLYLRSSIGARVLW